MLKEIRVKDPLFQREISYLVGGTEAELYAFVKARHGADVMLLNKQAEGGDSPEPDAHSAGNDGLQFHVAGEREHFYAWIANEEVSLLWHETFHLTLDVLTSVGISYSDESEEVFAYWGAKIFSDACSKIFSITKR